MPHIANFESHMFSIRRTVALISGCAALLLSGCVTDSGSGSAMPTAAQLNKPPTKDRVLWNYRNGLSALRQGKQEEAKLQFDEAISVIGNIFGSDKSAKKSRNYFNEESKKNFIGEPYERVMAYFYRGILYWMDGEADNARACFRSGELMDGDAEKKDYRSDFVTLDYLDGYATFKLDGDGSDAFKRAQEVSKIGQLPTYDKKANTLVFLEFGTGPTKYAGGEYGEELRIREGRSVVRGAWFKTGNKAIRIGAYDDLNFQATTRGGRVMDHILANKAVFKSTTDTIGNVAIVGGAITAMNRRSQNVGLGIIAAGVVSKIVSAATTPEADTRTWDNLPQFISFTALELPLGSHTATVEFIDAAGRIVPNLTKTVTFTIVEQRDTVLFVSDH